MIPAQHIRLRSALPRKLSGVTLVEVLVTVVVISIGLLGIAALHLTSLRASYDANSRSKALWFAHDIVEKMRANHDAAALGLYNLTLSAGAPTGGTPPEVDVRGWMTRLQTTGTGLPAGDASINIVNNVVTITVTWQERGDAGSSTSVVASSFMMQTEI